jgi:hypothetical protein
MIREIKEQKEIEVGDGDRKISVNGKLIMDNGKLLPGKGDQSLELDIVKAIRKDFPSEWQKINKEFNPKAIDIVINKGNIRINDESGKELINKEIKDTKWLKDVITKKESIEFEISKKIYESLDIPLPDMYIGQLVGVIEAGLERVLVTDEVRKILKEWCNFAKTKILV